MLRQTSVIAVALALGCEGSLPTLERLQAYKHQPREIDVVLPAEARGMQLHWEIAKAPAGSDADLFGSRTRTPTITADASGDYVVVAGLGGDVTAAAVGRAIVTVVNRAPVADAGLDRNVQVGEEVMLNGSSSDDADGDPIIEFSWRVKSLPSGSVTELNTDGFTASLVPDVPGEYVVTLEADDGEDVGVDEVSVFATESAYILPGSVRYAAAAYSPVLDRLVLAGESSAFIYDPDTRAATEISLSSAVRGIYTNSAARGISVSPSGLHAGILQVGGIGVLDLQDESYRFVATERDWDSIAVVDAEVAYGVGGIPLGLTRIDLSDGTLSNSSSNGSGARVVLYSEEQNAGYAAGNSLEKWDTSVNPPEFAYFGEQSAGYPLLLLGNSSLLTTRGRLFSTSPNPVADLLPRGDLGFDSLLTSASANSELLAVINDPGQRIWFYELPSQTPYDSHGSPTIAIDGSDHQTEARGIYLRGSGYLLVAEIQTSVSIGAWIAVLHRSMPAP